MRVLGARSVRVTIGRGGLSTPARTGAWQLHRAYATDDSAPEAASSSTASTPGAATPSAPDASTTPKPADAAASVVTLAGSTAVPAQRTQGRRRTKRAPPPEDPPLPQYFSAMGFPNLMEPSPLMDAGSSITFKPRPGSRLRHPATVTVMNDPSMFDIQREYERQRKVREGEEPADEVAEAAQDLRPILDEGISPAPHLRRFAQQTGVATHAYMLLFRRVVNQTPKGRRPRFSALTCVGNGAGLVGYGEGKDDEPARAQELAYLQALRNMDRVERFEQRTIFTELRTKLGATQIIMRPRPVGFGLRTNPYIHQILKAAGIKDASAKVWGSRNPLNVVKATFRMLWGGHAPQGMGDGFGGPARKLDKGSGVQTSQEVERARGRRLIDLRT